jgi:DnaJ like chaperone protein
MKSELSYARALLERQFGKARAADQVLLLRAMLNQNLNLRAVCEQIRKNMDHPRRLHLLHCVFGLSKADGVLDATEVRVIQDIAHHLGISQKDYESIRAMFGHDTLSAYRILEIDENASEAEIKKAYRRMAVKYHPDKVGHLGEEFQKAAKEKFQKVQEAYDSIKKQRNFT